MQTIAVPAPPPEAFNKQRRISDLIRAQVSHLKHLEEKLPPEVRAGLPQHAIVTEEDAARYIGPMTKLLCAQGGAAAAAAKVTPIRSAKRAAPVRPSRGLALAAAGAGHADKKPPKGKEITAKKTAGKSVPGPRRKG